MHILTNMHMIKVDFYPFPTQQLVILNSMREIETLNWLMVSQTHANTSDLRFSSSCFPNYH